MGPGAGAQPGNLPGVHGADDSPELAAVRYPLGEPHRRLPGPAVSPRVPGIAVNAGDWLQYGKQYWWLLVLGIVFSTPGPEKLWNRIRGTWLGTVVLAVLFWACVYCMSVATNDPFMYFSF